MNHNGTEARALPLTPKERIDLARYLHMKMLLVMRRNTDIDWLCTNVAYTREIQRLCRSHGTSEMNLWADRLEAMALSLEREQAADPTTPQHIQLDEVEDVALDFETTWPVDLK